MPVSVRQRIPLPSDPANRSAIQRVLDGLNGGLLDQLGQFLGEGLDMGSDLGVDTRGHGLQSGWRGRAVGTVQAGGGAFNGYAGAST